MLKLNKRPKTAIVWSPDVNVLKHLPFGAHIGFLPVAAVVGCDVLQWKQGSPPDSITDYDVFVVNLFHGCDYAVEDIRRIHPHAKIIGTPDSAPELQMNPLAGGDPLSALQVIKKLDVLAYRAHSNKLYGMMAGIPTHWMPIYVGDAEFFAEVRKQPKQDFILAGGHTYEFSTAGTLAALKLLQDKTGMLIVYPGADAHTTLMAAEMGLSVEYTGRLVYAQFVQLAAQARLAIDLYPCHSVGRFEITCAYAGTYCVGSQYTDFQAHRFVDPYEPEYAFVAAMNYLDNPAHESIKSAINRVEYWFGKDQVKFQFWHMVEEIMEGEIAHG